MPVRPVPPPPGPEGRPLSYSPTPIGSNDSQLSCMTISSDSVTGREAAASSLWEERKEEIAAAGLSGFGDSPTAVWVGNIPESSSSEEAIRELFERFGGIRRVFLRRKASPSPSWCLIMFRSSDAAGEALGATVAVRQADGSSVELFIEPPMVEQHLSKANPGALGSVVETALDDEEEEQEEPVGESEAARGQGSPGAAAGGEAWVVIKASIPREELLAFLHRNPVFSASSGVNPDEKNAFVERIAGRLERRFYSSNSMIVTKGSEATEMFFIYTGLAEVYMDHPDTVSKIPPVARLKVGTFFGEGALLSEGEQPRNSWIRATCDMEVYALCAGELKAALGAHPSVRKLFNTEKEKRDLKNTRSRWAVMKSSRFRNKLSTLSVFVHNDDDNEKAAKAAIKEVLRKVRVGQSANFDLFFIFFPLRKCQISILKRLFLFRGDRCHLHAERPRTAPQRRDARARLPVQELCVAVPKGDGTPGQGDWRGAAEGCVCPADAREHSRFDQRHPALHRRCE